MKRSSETRRIALCVGFWLAIASTLCAQEGVERKKAELTKEMTELLGVYGIEKPAKGIAIYLYHLMSGKKEKAYDAIETKDSAKKFIEKSPELKYLKANFADIPNVDFIGFRLVSTTISSYLYVMTTRDGPVAVRVDCFAFKNKFYLSQIHITRQWDEIMKMADSVRLLSASMEIKFNTKSE